MTGEEFNIIPTEFVFFKASPDESTVEVVFSFLAGTMGDGAGPGASDSGSGSSREEKRQRWEKVTVGRKREVTAWSKRGNKDRCRIRQNPTKIPHFEVFARREAKIALSNNSRPKTSGGRGPLGPRCRNQRPI